MNSERAVMGNLILPNKHTVLHTVGVQKFGSSVEQTKAHYNRAKSNKENKPIESKIPISAPTPISHSALDREAFKSILSSGDEEEVEIDAHISRSPTQMVPHTATLAAQTAKITLPLLYNQQNHTLEARTGQTFERLNDLVLEATSTPTPTQIIRVASPSTMMALTEPCLLAWCLNYPFDEETAPVPYIRNPSPKQFDVVGTPAASCSNLNHTITDVSLASVTPCPLDRYTRLQTMHLEYPTQKENLAAERNVWGY